MTTEAKVSDSDVKSEAKMEKLLSEHQTYDIPKVGDLIEGKIITVSKSEVHVDIDGLGAGVIRGNELIDESGDYSDLKKGDKVQATVLELENENREMELSFRSAGHQKAWDGLDKILKDKEIIEVKVTDANKGGLMVGAKRIEGFLPVSQLTTEHYPRVEGGDKNKILEILSSFIGQKFRVRIIDVDESENKLIVSEKAIAEEAAKEELAKLKVGDVVKGEITEVTDFGAFIRLSDVLDGLIHSSEMDWKFVEDPRKLIKPGDKVEAKIIDIEGGRISLSLKQLKEDPWQKIEEKYQVGQKVEGKIMKIKNTGAFIELPGDIIGLLPASEFENKGPEEAVNVGENYQMAVVSIEPEEHKLSLTLEK